jgi:hypothetical protein
MELSFAFLAKMADHLADGQLLLIGPDFDAVACSQFPVQIPISIAIKLFAEPREINKPHTLRIELTKPDGSRGIIGIESEIATRVNEFDPTRRSGASIVVNMLGMVFESAGDYLFHVIVDDREVKSLSLSLKLQEIEAQSVRRIS